MVSSRPRIEASDPSTATKNGKVARSMDGRSASKSIQPEDRRVLKKICLRELRDSTTYSVQFFFGFEVAPRPGSRSYLSLRDSKLSFGMKQCPDIGRFQRDKSDPSVVVKLRCGGMSIL